MTAAIPRRLLIADDDDDVRWTLREVFEPAGFQVRLAATGEEALEVFDRDPAVDCLLIDMNLPGISGLETIHQVAQTHPPAPPAILLTAHPTQDVLKRALVLRVFTVLSKPIGRMLVTNTVERAIRAHQRAS